MDMLSIIMTILIMFIPVQSDVIECNVTINQTEHNITINQTKLNIPTTRNHFDRYFDNLSNSINRPGKIDGWDCIDYSLDFVKNNPDWSLVTISPDKNFQRHVHGNKVHQGSHILCYNFYNNETMIVYDSLIDSMYKISNWQWDNRYYYHFWINGTEPVQYYRYLRDNRDQVYKQ